MRVLAVLALASACAPADALVDRPEDPVPDPPIEDPEVAPRVDTATIGATFLLDGRTGEIESFGQGFIDGAFALPSVAVYLAGPPELGLGCFVHLTPPGDGPWEAEQLVWSEVVDFRGEELLVEHIAMGLHPDASWDAKTTCPRVDLGRGAQDPVQAVLDLDLTAYATGTGIAIDAAWVRLQAYVQVGGEHGVGPRALAMGVDEEDAIQRTIHGDPVIVLQAIDPDGLPVRAVYDLWVEDVRIDNR